MPPSGCRGTPPPVKVLGSSRQWGLGEAVMWKGSQCHWEAVPRSRWCLSPVLPHSWAGSCCLVLHSQQKGQKLQSFITAGSVCSSCQGGRCSTGRGGWSIVASWECPQEAGAGRGAQGSGEGAAGAWHTWVCTCGLLPAHPGSTGSAREQGDSQENAQRVGMARAVLPALSGTLFPCVVRHSRAPGSGCCSAPAWGVPIVQQQCF